MFEQVRWSLLLSLTVCGTGQDDHELSHAQHHHQRPRPAPAVGLARCRRLPCGASRCDPLRAMPLSLFLIMLRF